MHFIEGHYDCGAVRASTRKQDLGELSLSLAAVLLCSHLIALRHLRAAGELAAHDPGRVPHSQRTPGPDRGNSMVVDVLLRMLMMVFAHHKLTPKDEEARHFQLVELNVIEQCLNLHKTGALCEQIC